MSGHPAVQTCKQLLRDIPVLGGWLQSLARRWRGTPPRQSSFPGSRLYWEERYARGGDSGAGSYGKFAEFKASVLNGFVADHRLLSIIEFGCGDGNQLTLARYPDYLGLDVSEAAIARCRARFASDRTRRFLHLQEYAGEKAELAISLDVIYHLVEDEAFEGYMEKLFASATRFVIIYSSDTNNNRGYEGGHVRHRKVTRWVRKRFPEWKLVRRIPNRYPHRGNDLEGSFADFFVYARSDA